MSKSFEEIFRETAGHPDTLVMTRELLEDFKRKAVEEERERISDRLFLSIGLYGGFHPDIAQALMAILKEVSASRYQEALNLIAEWEAKHGKR